MKQPQFLDELKELRCGADWHRRYYAHRAAKYHRIDFWMKSILGFVALAGAGLTVNADYRSLGAWMAGLCAFVTTNVLRGFNWDGIVSGIKGAEKDWITIFKGYEKVISYCEISDRGEMLVQEFQSVKEMEKAAALSNEHLPEDQELLDKCEADVRRYYALDKC